MKLLFGMLLSALIMMPAGVVMADEIVMETRVIDARVLKVRVDGQIDLKLKQGPTPALTVYAEKRWLPKITTVQTGDSLRIDTDVGGFHVVKPQLRAELTLPGLSELSSEGVGSVDIGGFSGDKLRLELKGAGKMTVDSQYKNVFARLDGVGSLNLSAGDSDGLELTVPGVGSMTIAGKTRTLSANMSGVGSLDAEKLTAQTVNLELNGVGSAKVFAQQTANLDLNGVGSVTVYGKPANRHAKSNGIGRVRWD
ncbi:MAG: DUF2807 domain-containing protein [Proteobacteria bacterium]|nr:DUF2807 domain-containing protein [Pseudomonadota bacterium]